MCWGPPRGGFRNRTVAGGVLLAMIGVFATAGRLTPPAEGFGAHTQLGLAPCSFPMLLGIPCPTCGMTTSFAYFAQADLVSSFHAHPAGAVLALGALATGLGAVAVLLRGRTIRINWYRIPPARVALGLVLLLLAGWGYKIMVGVTRAAP